LNKLVIFGSSSFAEIANAYFRRSNYSVIAHLVDSEYVNSDRSELFNVPIYEMNSHHGKRALSEATHFYVAATYTNLNRLRTEKYELLKDFGLIPASYISPNAFIDESVILGEHVFIFENNVIQFGSTIGNNCILWSGNHVGHHSKIGKNAFISSHVVISGHCLVGDNCFLGVNSTIFNNVEIGADNWISPNTVISKSTSKNQMFRVRGTEVYKVPPLEFFKINETSEL
jgi:sugar O-acyltransferase (sialic acid O-acetyltransferase NeuD family)